MNTISRFALIGFISLFSSTVLAHGGHDVASTANGFVNGFLHPFYGLDHMIAMVAVGLWGAFLGAPAIWLLPVIFPLVMAFGGLLGMFGVHLPLMDIGIYLSCIVLGAMVFKKVRASLLVTSLVVGLFAIFHGFAHGVDLHVHHLDEALPYCFGFVLSTGLLHVVGIAFGHMVKWPIGEKLTRAMGGLISLIGLAHLIGSVA